jgi:hypothetical protein
MIIKSQASGHLKVPAVPNKMPKKMRNPDTNRTIIFIKSLFCDIADFVFDDLSAAKFDSYIFAEYLLSQYFIDF